MRINRFKYLPLVSSVLLTTLISACNTQNTSKQLVEESIDNNQTVQTPLQNTVPSTSTSNESDAAEVKSFHRSIAAYKARERLKTQQKAKHRPSIQHSPVYTGLSFNNIQDNETYKTYKSNTVKQTLAEPLSTFSIDVDTGSYSNIRRLINNGSLPVKAAVRVEEMLNYFNYDYDNSGNTLSDSDIPFITRTEVAPSPWSKNHHLLQIGIKAVDENELELPAANLVFLIDVSGSMSSPNKLGLLKKSLMLLVSKMRPQDKVSLVVYAGASGVVLEPTAGNKKQNIIHALSRLKAGGSTNGASGIQLAYQVAQQGYITKGINRILLATDGDFNVGTVNFEQLKILVEEKRKTGISLSTLGFGSGNYNDHLMEQLADAANGNYSYIDTLKEAQKVLIDEMSSTLKTVAKDVKIQVEFNPSIVSEYRLIGYENRTLNKENFNNDKVDAGEIGAGHTVTAFYEVVLANSNGQQIDPLRYASGAKIKSQNSNELAFVKIRYKKPDEETSKLTTQAIFTTDIHASLDETSKDFRFASSVIGFGELLKGGQYQHDFTIDHVIDLSINARGSDRFGYRSEFTQLVKLAKSLKLSSL